jgi:sigma-E factor negative regulatory protein RseA
MSREALHESLSALLDDETTELELHRILAAKDDVQLRGSWSRYQVARAVMHKELIEPRLDLAAAVSAALELEPAHASSPLRSHKSGLARWQGLGRIAVAASVTVAVLAGVRLYNQDQLVGVELAQQDSQPMLGAPMVQSPVVLASYNPLAESQPEQASPNELVGSQWYMQHVPGYLRQHAQQASFASPDGALPFARSASLEGR